MWLWIKNYSEENNLVKHTTGKKYASNYAAVKKQLKLSDMLSVKIISKLNKRITINETYLQVL